MNKYIVGIAGLVLAGCVSWSDAPSVEDCKPGERHARYDHREIRLKGIFGLEESMLSDTNRFPMAKGRDYFRFELENPIEGFDEACYSFSHKKGKPIFGYMRLERVLHPDATDADLVREYERIVQWVAKGLGITVECRGLDDVESCRMSSHAGGFTRWSDTYMTIELAEGYEVQVRAREASYVKRDGDYIPATQAVIEFEIRNDGALPFAFHCLRARHNETEKKVREVSFGLDLTKALSDDMRDEAGLSDPEEKKLRQLRREIKAAEGGDVNMMNILAWKYHFGKDVKSDQKLSFKYSKMAADRGDARGIAHLAECYENGRGTDKNPEKAAELFKRSALMGNEWAMCRYGKCLADGIGVETNPVEAVKWFTKGAEGEGTWAYRWLARCHAEGIGTPKDVAKARECLNKALAECGKDPKRKSEIEEELKKLK